MNITSEICKPAFSKIRCIFCKYCTIGNTYYQLSRAKSSIYLIIYRILTYIHRSTIHFRFFQRKTSRNSVWNEEPNKHSFVWFRRTIGFSTIVRYWFTFSRAIAVSTSLSRNAQHASTFPFVRRKRIRVYATTTVLHKQCIALIFRFFSFFAYVNIDASRQSSGEDSSCRDVHCDANKACL